MKLFNLTPEKKMIIKRVKKFVTMDGKLQESVTINESQMRSSSPQTKPRKMS